MNGNGESTTVTAPSSGLQPMATGGATTLASLLALLGTKTSGSSTGDVTPLTEAFTKGMAGLSPTDAQALIKSIMTTGQLQVPGMQQSLGAATGARIDGNSPLALALNQQNNTLSANAMASVLQANQQGLATATQAANGIAQNTHKTSQTQTSAVNPLMALLMGTLGNQLGKSGIFDKIGGSLHDAIFGAKEPTAAATSDAIAKEQAAAGVDTGSGGAGGYAGTGTDVGNSLSLADSTTTGATALDGTGMIAPSIAEGLAPEAIAASDAATADLAGGIGAGAAEGAIEAGATDWLGGLGIDEIMGFAMLADGGMAGNPAARTSSLSPALMADSDEEAEEGIMNPASGIPALMSLKPFLQYADGGSVAMKESAGLVQGPGSGVSDSIPVRSSTPGGSGIAISNQEYIIPADVVKAMGVKHFDNLVAAFHTPVRR